MGNRDRKKYNFIERYIKIDFEWIFKRSYKFLFLVGKGELEWLVVCLVFSILIKDRLGLNRMW